MVKLPFGSAVNGVSFRQDAVRASTVGEQVTLSHDRTNPADPNAVAVAGADGRMLGYLPAALSARMVCQGSCWRGEIAEVLSGHDTVGLRIKVTAALGDGEVPLPQACPVDAAEQAESGRDEPTVRARSGRMLGRLVREDGQRVVVRQPNGAEVAFPAAVVEIDAA